MTIDLRGARTFIEANARVLDQLLYKWDHSRQVIAKVLTDKFAEMSQTGRQPTKAQIDDTVRLMLADNFETFRAAK